MSANYSFAAYRFDAVVCILSQLRCTTISILSQDVVTAKQTVQNDQTWLTFSNVHKHKIPSIDNKRFDVMVERFEM